MAVRNAHLHLRMRRCDDVIPYLGKGEKDWKLGRSAHALCTTWATAKGLPSKVRAVLASHPDCNRLELVDGFFERRVDLGDGGTPSQTDLMVICGDSSGLLAMAVEGKVDETFDKRVRRWRDGSPTKEGRLEALCATLGLVPDTVQELRYQLLHRTASSIYEARRYRASRAMMLVHSFCPRCTGIEDFASFARAIGFTDATANRAVGPKSVGGVDLFMAWVSDVPIFEGIAIQ